MIRCDIEAGSGTAEARSGWRAFQQHLAIALLLAMAIIESGPSSPNS